MKYVLGMFSLMILTAGSVVAQQRNTNQKPAGNSTLSTTQGSGTGQSPEQYNTTAGDASSSTTSTGVPQNSLPRNSNNQTNPTVGTGTTLDQNAGAGSNSPSPAVSPSPIPTKTDNTSSVREGGETGVKAKKIKPPKENK
ncbi:hypothetical protein GCM10028807_45690 [Spirosoma daeguense]